MSVAARCLALFSLFVGCDAPDGDIPMSSTPTGPYGKADGAECLVVDSAEQDTAPVQVVGGDLPPGAEELRWVEPTEHEYRVPVDGVAGAPASHEGVDYVHPDASVTKVDVRAAADGTVVHVRIGCPQSATFSRNTSARECAAGWGDHIVIAHSDGIHTRYAHLAPGSVGVVHGDQVQAGEVIAEMGNTGRSEVRHLHFELGTLEEGTFESCGDARSFHRVYRPTMLAFGEAGGAQSCVACVEGGGGRACAGRCAPGPCRTCIEFGGGEACIDRCE